MHILIFNPIVPKTACLKTQQGQNFNIPNGCKISGIKLSFCFRLAEVPMLVGCEARGYKDRNARESWRNYFKLFSIISHSQGFTQTVLCFPFHPVLFLFDNCCRCKFVTHRTFS